MPLGHLQFPLESAKFALENLMSLENEIMKAVGAHGAWKMRLKTAIGTGVSEVPVTTVQQDNQCDFGKWLYGNKTGVRSAAHQEKVRQIHARFHKEAARVLDLALKGQKVEAEKSLAAGGAFTQLSAELSTEMMAWRNAEL